MDRPIWNEQIEKKIFQLRGNRVMLDVDLAALYGVEVRALNQAVKRHIERFPEDFICRLSRKEIDEIVRSEAGASRYKGLKFSKNVSAFTERGIAMLSGVVDSPRAVQVGIVLMREFFQLRGMLATNKALSLKLAALYRRLERHDGAVQTLFEAMRRVSSPGDSKTRKIRLHVNEAKKNQAKVWVEEGNVRRKT
ncbi:MAG TPA: ORF6N domain-containing protein [Nitrospiria bacterium]|nr:ORF6N domain-containing protein [Nitrospiria bacterium]